MFFNGVTNNEEPPPEIKTTNKSSFLRGFIKEIFSLIGIVGGIFIASRAAFMGMKAKGIQKTVCAIITLINPKLIPSDAKKIKVII